MGELAKKMMSNETNKMIDFCEYIKEQIDKIKSQCSDLQLSLDSLSEDVWEKYPEQEDIWDNIQLCISHIASATSELNKVETNFNCAYNDIHYNEFEAMKE